MAAVERHPFGLLESGTPYAYEGVRNFEETAVDELDQQRLTYLCIAAIGWRDRRRASTRLVSLQPPGARAAKRRRVNSTGAAVDSEANGHGGGDDGSNETVLISLFPDVGARRYHVLVKYPADTCLRHSQLSELQTLAPVHVPPDKACVYYQRHTKRLVLAFDVCYHGHPIAQSCTIVYFTNPPVQGGIVSVPSSSSSSSNPSPSGSGEAAAAAVGANRVEAEARKALETLRRAHGRHTVETGRSLFVAGHEPATGESTAAAAGAGGAGHALLFGVPTRFVELQYCATTERGIAESDRSHCRLAVMLLQWLSQPDHAIGGSNAGSDAYAMDLAVAHDREAHLYYMSMTYEEVAANGAREYPSLSLDVDFMAMGTIVGALGRHYVNCEQFYIAYCTERNALYVQLCLAERDHPLGLGSGDPLYIMRSSATPSRDDIERPWSAASSVAVSTPTEAPVPLEGYMARRSNVAAARGRKRQRSAMEDEAEDEGNHEANSVLVSDASLSDGLATR